MILEFVSLVVYYIGLVTEYFGIFIVAYAIIKSLLNFIINRFSREKIRADLAHNLIFGLEFIIAADILLVTVANSLNEILQLGGIVIIRILLGYSLRKEILAKPKMLQ